MKTRLRWLPALCLAVLSLSMLGAAKGPLPYAAKKLLDCKSFGCEIGPLMSVPGGVLFPVYGATASSDFANQYLWFSDGSPEGTIELLELCWNGGSTYSMLYPREGTSILLGTKLYFFAPYATDSGCAWGLWRFDSSDKIVERIRDNSFGRLALMNNQIYLFEGPNYGLENSLWIIQEPLGGTELIRQFEGMISGIMQWENLFILAIKMGDGESRFAEIWSSDGKVEGTKYLATRDYRYCEVGSNAFTLLKGSLLFVCYDPEASSFELWKTNGVGSGTALVKGLSAEFGFYGYYGNNMASVNDLAFFSGWHTLYQTDGTAAGTQQVYAVDMYNKPYNFISWFFPYKGALYFYGEPIGYGGLFKTYGRNDGEEEGQIITVSSAEADTGPYCYEPFKMLDDRLYFQRDYPGYDYRLTDSWYWTDGTNVNTLSAPADDYQNPCDLTLFKGRLFFSAYDKGDNQTNLNNELWVDDGITTHRLVDLDGEGWKDYSKVTRLTISGDDLFFINSFRNVIFGDELWVYAPLTEKIYLPSVRR